jgi:NADH:quinone reductase (non-electrogenic)
MSVQPEPPRVVIVGGGFGGLEAAKALARSPAHITLLDRQNHHCFQPLLYQVATAVLSPADIAWPIRAILRKQQNVTVLMAAVSGVDTTGKRVLAGEMSFPYDYLVLATGATHSYFGHDDWSAFAPGLKRIEDATEIRRRMLLAFEQAELSDSEAEQKKLLTFVIIGGGPTGVEMAGSMAEVAFKTLHPEFRRIEPRHSRILLIEGGPRILAALPEKLSRYAQNVLEEMGVEVMTKAIVTGVGADGIDIGSDRLEASTIIWAAGVIASPAAAWLCAERDRAGRVKVGPDLSVPGLPDIFAIGDTAAATDASGQSIPGIAPAAKQMGRYVGRLIAARLAGSQAPPAFVYRHAGDLAAIGRRAAVVKLGRLELTGFIGWLFWGVVHVYFLIGVRNRFVVAFTWLWNYLTFQRGARLITRGLRAP